MLWDCLEPEPICTNCLISFRIPIRISSIHCIIDDSSLAGLVRGLQSVFPREWRVRVRVHSGSWQEIQYSLRSHGIDIPGDWMTDDIQNPFSTAQVEKAKTEWLAREAEWREKDEISSDQTRTM